MSLILHIDTATRIASICLAENKQILGFEKNEEQKDHASWLHPAIISLLNKKGIHLRIWMQLLLRSVLDLIQVYGLG